LLSIIRPDKREDLQIGAVEEATKGDSEMKKGRFSEERIIEMAAGPVFAERGVGRSDWRRIRQHFQRKTSSLSVDCPDLILLPDTDD